MTTTFSLPSFAKINLALRVLGKRPDGYHEIRTVLQTVSLHDDLSFAENSRGEITLTSNDPQLATDSSNLIIKSAQALRDFCNVQSGASINLEKRIPVKGGLGGGSSNAAVTLMGLCRLWNLDLGPTELLGIAAALGADVPFFFHGGRALATGTGTQIQSLPDSEMHRLLILAPKATVSTADAYKALNAPALTTPEADSILAISRTEANFDDSKQWPLCDHLSNDFERVIFDIEPEILRAKNALIQAGARCALLSGSGSSVFAVFENEEVLSFAANALREESGWRIFSCVTLSRVEYLDALSSAAFGR